ncbi:hypothetical protein Aduo_010065 [Ancylostoma duodenale]
MANMDKFITWPNREDEEQIKLRFYQLTGIPEIIGCVDGSHVEIRAPLETEYAYVNRKGWHSINVGLACDFFKIFIWVSAKYPGRSHDSRVFRESAFYRDFVSGRRRGVLLGGSAYQAETFLLKPILSARTEPERRYTNALCRGRVIIEDAIGALKSQFQCLYSALRYDREQPDEEEDPEPETAEEHSSAISFRNHIIANYFSR